MYVIKAWTRDFRDEETRRGDWSCYSEYEDVTVDRFLLFFPIKKRRGKPGTFINDRIIQTFVFKRMGLGFKAKYLECAFCDDFTEVAYIPDSIQEYNFLDEVATRVIRGDYGNQPDREYNLRRDGYNYMKVQSFVNYKMGVYNLFEKKDFEKVLQEVVIDV